MLLILIYAFCALAFGALSFILGLAAGVERGRMLAHRKLPGE